MSRFVYEAHLRWSDMDAFRHINNTAYFAYLEQARVAMFFDRGATFADGVVVARHEIDYLGPVVYHPEPLRLELWIDQVRGASFTVHYEVFDAERIVARALTLCAPFDFAVDRPRRLTAAERTVLAGYADSADSAEGADSVRVDGAKRGR